MTKISINQAAELRKKVLRIWKETLVIHHRVSDTTSASSLFVIEPRFDVYTQKSINNNKIVNKLRNIL